MATEASSPPLVIIDTDPGIDDMMALLIALAAHNQGKIRVLGLTIVHGNHSDLDLLAKNACLALHIAGLSDSIKVIKGESNPLTTDYHGHSGIEVHGENGLGGIPHPFEPSLKPLEHDWESAAKFLVDTCALHPGEVSVLPLGPLSNIGAALNLDRDFANTCKDICMMGGNIYGRGNKTPAAEANMHNDPEAGKLMFECFGEIEEPAPRITMAGLSVTHQVVLTEELREELASECGSVGRYCKAITQHYVDLLKSWGDKAYVHDSSAILAFLHPELYESRLTRVGVECTGDLTRGATVADFYGQWKKPAQTCVLEKVNVEEFCRLMKTYYQWYSPEALVYPPVSTE